MKRLLLLFTLLLTVVGAQAQGQVLFANRVDRVEAAGLDAPVFFRFTERGPGPDYTAQLVLVGAGGSLTPLVPTSTFLPLGPEERYWSPKTVDVPGVLPNNSATFVVRVWQTAAGSFEVAKNATVFLWGESLPFAVTVGGGTLDPAPLVTLQGFSVIVPEPSTYVLGIVGGAIFFLWRRK